MRRAHPAVPSSPSSTRRSVDRSATKSGGDFARADFMAARAALAACGIPVVDAALAKSEEEAVALQRRFAAPVAVKAETPGLLHKSDIGGVRLNCADATEVAEAYRTVIANARSAGF